MSKIILTRGIQGSGKSTWAKKWVEEDPHTGTYNKYKDILTGEQHNE